MIYDKIVSAFKTGKEQLKTKPKNHYPYYHPLQHPQELNRMLTELQNTTISAFTLLNKFKQIKKQRDMKPTPITDILNKKLSKLHSEVDDLIIKKVKKDLTMEQWNSLDKAFSKKVHDFMTLSFMRDKLFDINDKIDLFKRLEEL